MNKPIDNQVIVDIIKTRIGKPEAINQYDIADEYIRRTGDHITARTTRNVIEDLRFLGYPILSSTDEPGGYYYPANRREYFEWKDREMAKAKKQIAKLRPVGFGVYKYFRPHVLQQVFDFGKRLVKVG
jgi:hypothetical protein